LEAERRKSSRESSNARDFPVFHHRTACAQCRQIDIWIILGKIGFEWLSAHAEGFLKAVGRKPSGGSVRRSTTQETTGYFDSPGSLRCSAFICRLARNATSSMSRFDGIGLAPFR
jgi:hypothetical protein